jgi:hypothetical protein
MKRSRLSMLFPCMLALAPRALAVGGDGVSNGAPPQPGDVVWSGDEAKALADAMAAAGVPAVTTGDAPGYETQTWSAGVTQCRQGSFEAVGPGGVGWIRIPYTDCTLYVSPEPVTTVALARDASEAVVEHLKGAGIPPVSTGLDDRVWELNGLACTASPMEVVLPGGGFDHLVRYGCAAHATLP